MNREDLSAYSRKQLQSLAKKHGIQANLSSQKIIDELLQVMDTNPTKDCNETVDEPVKKKKKTTGLKESREPEKSQSTSTSACSSVLEIPQYWGSILEGVDNPLETYRQVIGTRVRQASLSLICEPYVMQLFRIAGATNVSRDAVVEAKKLLVEFIAKTCSAIATEREKSAVADAKKIEPEEVKTASNVWGFHMCGAKGVSATSCPYVSMLALVNEKHKELPNEWDVFSYAIGNIHSMQVSNIYSLLEVKRLVDTGRATVANIENPSPIAQACVTLDSYVFRYLLSFLVSGTRNTKISRSQELFTEKLDINDNWSSDVDYATLNEALTNNVNVLEAEDDHTSVTLLHNFAIRDRADDCQKLLEMGIDVDVSTGSGFENGDGWGELEYCSFTSLHFACSNGYSDVAKVLLKNGASIKHAAWDGGYFCPAVSNGSDYFYTGGNTPLHQAARGNHANIIHLLLDGPDEASKAYAASKNIDLSEWENVDIEDSKPSIELYDDHGNDTTFNVTPLGMALMFGNLDAVLALLQHGADLNFTNNTAGLKLIARGVVKNRGKFKDVLKKSLAAYPHHAEDILWKSSGDSDDGSEDEEEEEPWEKDDWDKSQVPEGDSKVLVKEDEDDDDADASAGFLPAVECKHAEGIIAILKQAHPSHQMSRNCQFVADDFLEFVMDSVGRQLLKTEEKVLSLESMLAVAPILLTGDLVKFAVAECNKEKPPMLVDAVREYMTTNFPSIELSDKGLDAASKFFEYCLIEILELGGNFARDCYLSSIHPYHLFNIEDDELEKSFFDFCSMGTAIRMKHKTMILKRDGIFTNDKANHDYFNQDWVNEKDTRGTTDEIILSFREHRVVKEHKYGVNILPSAFQTVLEQQCSISSPACSGRFSEDGALAMQIVCELAVCNVISKATETWKARSEETLYKEFPFIRGDDMKSAYDEARVILEGRLA